VRSVPLTMARYQSLGSEHTRKWQGTCTQRRPFNYIVAFVIIINAMVIGFEADLGLLGTGGKAWGSVKEDLNLLGYHGHTLQMVEDEVHKILAYDAKYKQQAKAEYAEMKREAKQKYADMKKGAAAEYAHMKTSAAQNMKDFKAYSKQKYANMKASAADQYSNMQDEYKDMKAAAKKKYASMKKSASKYADQASDYANKKYADAKDAYKDYQKDDSRRLDEEDDDGRRLYGNGDMNDGAYTLIEYFFVGFFIFELWIRLCDQGCVDSFFDPWMWFDFLVVLCGVADLSLPIFMKVSLKMSGAAPKTFYKVLSLLRISRVLRIVRLFRVLPELRDLIRPFSSALGIVIRIILLITVIDFCIAILTTTLIGQKSVWWGDDAKQIDTWFGSIGRSMETLGLIMTLNGWNNIATVLGEVIPTMIIVPCMVLYIMLCTLAVFGIVTGAICDSFASRARETKAEQVRGTAHHRAKFERNLKEVLEFEGKVKDGYLTKEEFQACLQWEWYILSDLQVLDPDATMDSLLEQFDELVRVNPDQNKLIKFDQLAEAIAHRTGDARAVDMINVKDHCRSTRREAQHAALTLKSDIAERHRESAELTKGVYLDQGKIQSCVRELQMTCSGLRSEFGSLMDKMDNLQKREDMDKKEAARTFAEMKDNCVILSTNVKACLQEQGKLFTTQIADVQKQADAASESMVEMKEEVAGLPEQVGYSTRSLDDKVNAIRRATKRLAHAKDIPFNENEILQEELRYVDAAADGLDLPDDERTFMGPAS